VVFGLLGFATALAGIGFVGQSPHQSIYSIDKWQILCAPGNSPMACWNGHMNQTGPSVLLIANGEPAGDIEVKAAATLAWYLRSWSGQNDQALMWLERAYGESIDYYGKLTAKPVVMGEKKRFAERWPLRTYVARPEATRIQCDAERGQCTLTGIVDWTCRSEARHARSTGSANFQLIIRLMRDQGPVPVVRIVGESGSVISRLNTL
jgi:hypothetical protein